MNYKCVFFGIKEGGMTFVPLFPSKDDVSCVPVSSSKNQTVCTIQMTLYLAVLHHTILHQSSNFSNCIELLTALTVLLTH